jgi:hypothetical protein
VNVLPLRQLFVDSWLPNRPPVIITSPAISEFGAMPSVLCTNVDFAITSLPPELEPE